MNHLKRTPWKIALDQYINDEIGKEFFDVIDSEGYGIAYYLDEPTARAIAALPETLERLERLEEAARNAVLQIEYLHEKFNETGSGNQAIAQLKKALEDG